MVLTAKRRFGRGWPGLERPRPGGRRGGSMIRFAESDSDSEICIRNTAFGFVPLTLPEPARGWPYSKRYAHSAGPTSSDPQHTSFWQLNPLLFLAFGYLLLHYADSASVLPFSMPHEADSAAILPFMLLYEADSDAMLPYFLLYETDHAAILLI